MGAGVRVVPDAEADVAGGLRCVVCGSTRLRAVHGGAAHGAQAGLRCADCREHFPSVDGILQMIPPESALRRAAADPRPRATIGDVDQARFWDDDSHGFRPAAHPIVRYFSEQRWNYLSRRIDLSGCRTALDVGCGDGFSTLYAPPHWEITACDGSLTMLRRHPGARRIQADAFRLPFADRSFDVVFAWELLHHVSQPWRVVAEMRRVSRRWVFGFEPNPVNPAQFLFALCDPAHRWVLRYSRQYLRRQIEPAGLRIVLLERVGCLFPNRTPAWLFPLLRRMPFHIPLVGISHLWAAEPVGDAEAGRVVRKDAA